MFKPSKFHLPLKVVKIIKNVILKCERCRNSSLSLPLGHTYKIGADGICGELTTVEIYGFPQTVAVNGVDSQVRVIDDC